MSSRPSGNKKNNFSVLEGILIALIILVIAFMLSLFFLFRNPSKPANVFGYTIYKTSAINMEPKIHAGTAVIGSKKAVNDIKVGSAVLCYFGDDIVVTRVQQIASENGEMSYIVKFDTSPQTETVKLSSDKIIANCIWTYNELGSLITFATSTLGIMLVIIIPSLIIIVMQVIRIVNTKREEEEASSLDDLEEIMLPDFDDRSQITFLEPKIEEPLPEEKPQVLTIDKNGKAGFSSVDDSNSPLFTYDNVFIERKPEPAPEEKKPSTVKPIKLPKSQDFFESYAPEYADGPLYDEKKAEKAARRAANSAYAEYLSNVLPERLSETASGTESTDGKKVTFEKADDVDIITPSASDKAVISTPIPEKAVAPEEKIAPPKKANNSKTLSELMSMIDAEESKLKK